MTKSTKKILSFNEWFKQQKTTEAAATLRAVRFIKKFHFKEKPWVDGDPDDHWAGPA